MEKLCLLLAKVITPAKTPSCVQYFTEENAGLFQTLFPTSHRVCAICDQLDQATRAWTKISTLTILFLLQSLSLPSGLIDIPLTFHPIHSQYESSYGLSQIILFMFINLFFSKLIGTI